MYQHQRFTIAMDRNNSITIHVSLFAARWTMSVCGGLVLPPLILGTGLALAYFRRVSISQLAVTVNISAWLMLWALRPLRDPSRRQDLALFVILLVSRYLWSDPSLLRTVRGYNFPFGLAITALSIFAAYFIRRQSRSRDVPSTSNPGQETKAPTIHPCRTTHTRLFPERHAFSYAYLQVSVPVDFEGTCGLVSVGSTSKKAWFHVQASDYLERGSSIPSLKAKLSAYLESEGVNSSQWYEARLVTAPRFLGYSFNPVSFWYIYDEHQQLIMMVLEVNNTFDERRMYLLTANGSKPDDNDEIDPKQEKNGRFKNAWAKDFHVSPFNSRKGHYSLSAADPRQDGRIDNTIVLKSSKDHVKLIARIFSEGPSVNPSQLSILDEIGFLGRWFWVGFATFPRILNEAVALFFRKGLHVWFRPEVLPSSIGRNPTSTEINLESFFVKYLEDVVKRSGANIEVSYDSGLPDSQKVVFRSMGKGHSSTAAKHLDIKVLTPAFFSRFVHYAHTPEAFDRECIFTDEKNRTIWISKPALLPALFGAGAGASQQSPLQQQSRSWRWYLVQRLRYSPEKPSYGSPYQAADGRDIRALNLSPLDTFVQRRCADDELYRRCCVRLFLARRFAFGHLVIIDALDLALRVTLIWLGVIALIKHKPPTSLDLFPAYRNWHAAFALLMRLSLVHLYVQLKR